MSHRGRVVPRPTTRGWLALLAGAAIVGACVGWVGTVRAQEVEPVGVERYVPTSRGVLRGWHADLVAEHFPPGQVGTALAVMACESRGLAGATGGAGEKGLMQIHPIWQPLADRMFWPGVSLYDADVNVAVAAVIWRAMGWSAWSCYR